MKKIIILTLALAIFVTACKQKQETQAPQKPTVKIGAIFPLSGPVAFWGDALKQGVEMAQEDLGETKFKYEIILEDDQMDPKKTALAFQKLVNVDKVDVIISAAAGPGNVVAPLAEKHRIPHFAIGSDPNMAIGKFNFIHWTPPPKEAQAFVKLLKEKNLKRIALFNFNHQGSKTIEAALIKAIEGTDI